MPDLPPPFRSVQGVPNFRDIGGYPVADASSAKQSGHIREPVIRNGLVYRSAEPSRITDDGKAALSAFGITHVYDLRSTVEAQRAPLVSWPGSPQLVFAPVFHEQDYSPEAIALRFSLYASAKDDGFVQAYGDILRSGATGPFKAILTHLAQPNPGALLVHCTAGKDRTGVICALVLSLCGVADETIAKEYALTEIGLAERLQELKAHLSAALDGDAEGAVRMLGARPEAMLGTLEMIRREYGSVENYITSQCQLSSNDIEQIRHNLITSREDQAPAS